MYFRGSHWALVIIDNSANSITYFDSLLNHREEIRKIIGAIREVFQVRYKEQNIQKSLVNEIIVNKQIQTNGYDCVSHVCKRM